MKNSYTPRELVAELDTYIIGQKEAKKMVAIALRNRWRAKQLPEDVREEYVPKNILLIGPTGVGKTELARRLAKLVNAPFIKVEATKYTEVGYVGSTVDDMIRGLVDNAIRMLQTEAMAENYEVAKERANQRILQLLWPKKSGFASKVTSPMELLYKNKDEEEAPPEEGMSEKRAQYYRDVCAGVYDDREVEFEVEDKGNALGSIWGNNPQQEQLMSSLSALENMLPKKMKKRKATVAQARTIFIQEESEHMLDMDALKEKAIHLTEQEGIVFIDEFDKIAVSTSQQGRGGTDVSREGVQRDILPIVEGSIVPTKYGPVHTDHILFIAAGAFHVTKPSDLIPELQGRFPIRVELDSLTKEDFKEILTTPHQALIKQYYLLLKADNVTIHFEEDAIDAMAEYAYRVNNEVEDIGARRLHTILEKLLQDISYNAPSPDPVDVTITRAMVEDRLGAIVDNQDLSNYIL